MLCLDFHSRWLDWSQRPRRGITFLWSMETVQKLNDNIAHSISVSNLDFMFEKGESKTPYQDIFRLRWPARCGKTLRLTPTFSKSWGTAREGLSAKYNPVTCFLNNDRITKYHSLKNSQEFRESPDPNEGWHCAIGTKARMDWSASKLWLILLHTCITRRVTRKTRKICL